MYLLINWSHGTPTVARTHSTNFYLSNFSYFFLAAFVIWYGDIWWKKGDIIDSGRWIWAGFTKLRWKIPDWESCLNKLKASTQEDLTWKEKIEPWIRVERFKSRMKKYGTPKTEKRWNPIDWKRWNLIKADGINGHSDRVSGQHLLRRHLNYNNMKSI